MGKTVLQAFGQLLGLDLFSPDFYSKRLNFDDQITSMAKFKQAKLDSFFQRNKDSLSANTSISASQAVDAPVTSVTSITSIPEDELIINEGKTNDLGFVLKKHTQLTDAERYRLLTSDGPKNVTILDTVRQSRRKFLKKWLDDNRFCSWLVYTQLSDGRGLCKICIVMQARLKHGTLRDTAFVTRPCIDYKKFMKKAVAHRDTNYHRESNTAAKNFVKSMETGQNVRANMEAQYATQTKENRRIMTSIVKTVMFCASGNIPLRGHSGDSGNFVNLLLFRIDAGDEDLKWHFARMAGNAKYTSPMIQNEILKVASDMIVQDIVMKANKSFVSVIADESCDISGKEQLSIVFRNVKGGEVCERFTGLVEMDSVSVESISSNILTHLSGIGVDLQKLVGQGYDGATTMAGHVSGVQKRIRDKYPRAIFVHCASHCLNLEAIIRSTCDIIRETIRFFRESPKRRAGLGINIPLFCPTRWSEKYKSIRIFKCNFKRVLEALDSLARDANSETRAKAFSLKSALEKSSVIYASVIAEERNDSEIALNIYKEACEIAGLKELTIPRVVEVQVYRDNVCADSASQYFKRSVYLPYVDGLSCSIRERFIDNPSFFSLLSILPPNKPVHVDEVEHLYLLDNLQNEVRLWRTSLSSDVNDECLEGLLLSARDYPSVYTAIQIVMTLLATTVEAERSFSCMKRVSESTIRNCFLKAKFIEEEIQFELDDVDLLEIWEALPAEEKMQENEEIELSDFLEADERIETGGFFTLDEIAEEMLRSEEPLKSVDDEIHVEEEIVSFEDAQQAWRTVRKFMQQRSGKPSVL
ncbi:52 kDa repressor of the inhibitor of the protein kinase-like [Styela clava]